MPYIVKLRHGCSKGQVLGTVGPFDTKDAAVKQAQVLADDSAGHVVVVVEKTRAKRKTNPKRNASYRTHPGEKPPRAGEPPSRRDYLVLFQPEEGSLSRVYADIYDKFGRLVKSGLSWPSQAQAGSWALTVIDNEIRRRKAIEARRTPEQTLPRKRNAKWGRLVETIGTVKVYKDSEWGEYAVVPPGAKEAQVYRTDDRQDALDTAKVIASGRKGNPIPGYSVARSPSMTRKFGGLTFTLQATNLGKRAANKLADQLRAAGGKARVVHSKAFAFMVYGHGGRSNPGSGPLGLTEREWEAVEQPYQFGKKRRRYKGVVYETFQETSTSSGYTYGKAWALGIGNLAVVSAWDADQSEGALVRKAKAWIDAHPNAAKEQAAYIAETGRRPNPKGGPQMLIHGGHAIEKRGRKYVVLPYGWEFKTQKAAQRAIDKHVSAEMGRRPNRRTVERKGYWRTLPAGQYGHGRKGQRVKGKTWIEAGLITDRGLPGEGPATLPEITKGGLGGPGYTDKSARTRHGILRRVVRAEGYQTALGRIMLLERYGSRTMGADALRVLAADREWLVATFGGPGSVGPRGAPKRRTIDGKRYTLASTHRDKRTAQQAARAARASGMHARIVSSANRWALYTHKG